MSDNTPTLVQGESGEIFRFWYDTVRNEQASNAEGRPIFDTVLMMEIITSGQQASAPQYEVERTWAEQSVKALGLPSNTRQSQKYAEYRQYIEKYKANSDANLIGGTPLTEWPRIDRGLSASLSAAGVHTVEQLSALPDSQMHLVGMGGRELREQALAFLGQAAGSADVGSLAARLAAVESENQRLQGELSALSQHNALLNQRINTPADGTGVLSDTTIRTPTPEPVQNTGGNTGGGLAPLV